MLRRATEEGIGMKKYMELEMEVIFFEENDIITESGGGGGDTGPINSDWPIFE